MRTKKRKNIDTECMGLEPEAPVGVASRMDRTHAYNWYNYFWDSKKSAATLSKYLTPTQNKLLSKLSVDSIPPTLCYIEHMKARGWNLPEETLSYCDNLLNNILDKAKSIKQKTMVVTNKQKNPAVRTQQITREHIGFLEEKLDSFVNNNYQSDFSCYKWMQSSDLKKAHASAIVTFYEPQLEDLKSKEGYEYLSTREYNRFVKFLEMIIDDANTWVGNQKRKRKPRKRKTPTIENQVKSVQFLDESKEYSYTSVRPEMVVGVSSVWTLNVKYRTLTMYQAKDENGFSFKGTTLQNFDEEKSISKACRKPQLVLNDISKGGKVTLRKIMQKLNTKEKKVTGRFGKDTLILRVIK